MIRKTKYTGDVRIVDDMEFKSIKENHKGIADFIKEIDIFMKAE